MSHLHLCRYGGRIAVCAMLASFASLAIGRETTTTKTTITETTITLPADVPLVIVRIPAGKFVMGSSGDPGWDSEDEAPTHTVTIDYAFYMGKYEVTQRQWLALVGSWPGPAPNPKFGRGDNYPAYSIPWNDTQNFIAALNEHVKKTAQGPATFRLPSESEWEYACRAGSTTRFCFGDSTLEPGDGRPGPAGDLGDYGWFMGNNSPYGSKRVGTKRPNVFGLYDMHGNVWEWCQDFYHSSYTGAPADGSAWGAPAREHRYRVVRGGYWYFPARYCRSATRYYLGPASPSRSFGFRLARNR